MNAHYKILHAADIHIEIRRHEGGFSRIYATNPLGVRTGAVEVFRDNRRNALYLRSRAPHAPRFTATDWALRGLCIQHDLDVPENFGPDMRIAARRVRADDADSHPPTYKGAACC